VREHEEEPVRGLPEVLPAGEIIVWQGAPQWRRLAVEAFHVRKVALYFGLLMLWHAGAGVVDGQSWAQVANGLVPLLLSALAATGLLSLLARLSAGATLYTITNRRVVMRIGVAMSMTLNLPFKAVESACLRLGAGGVGDIALSLGEGRIAYLHLWPHARPWRLARPQPVLRAVANAADVALRLSQVVDATVAVSRPQAATGSAPAVDPHQSASLATAA
jgi:hypothetical protein